MVNQLWLKRKLKKTKRKKWLRNMENKDVKVVVTGVAMSGESQLNEHNRTLKDDKEESKGE